jgi:nitroimidazol reductase NimA-like FMN-containing flavoprotein (pyridoxamine 5'-phosphate oxidase superfamily)
MREAPDAASALTHDQCMALLASTTVGRVAVTSRALPAVVPVNYLLAGNRIVFRTKRSGMLARACDDAVVGFQVDDLEVSGRSGWSVLVVGVARLLEGSADLRALELNLVSAVDGFGGDQFVGITLGQVSGRLVVDSGLDSDPDSVPVD